MMAKITAPLSWVFVWVTSLVFGAGWIFVTIGAPAFDALAASAVIAAGAADTLFVRRRLRTLLLSCWVEYRGFDMDAWWRMLVFVLLPIALGMASHISGLPLLPSWLLIACWSLACLIFYGDLIYVLPPTLAHTVYARMAGRRS